MSRSEPTPARRLTSDEFRDVIGHFASGVTVVTALAGGRRHGTTASAVTSLSLEPPMLLICMSRESSTGQAVAATGAFAVNILGEEHGELATRFARKGADKFDGVELADGEQGRPLLAGAIAHLECRVSEQVIAGTHFVFIAEVESATARRGAPPLAYFRGRFGRLELAEDAIVYAQLRERVLECDASAGAALDVAQLAADLEVGEGPVFHAFSKLVAEGLVERDAGGHFAVGMLTADAIRDAYAARRAIELGVADVTVGRVGPEALAELRRLMEATLALVRDDRVADVDAWVRADAAFHEHMVALAGSPALLAGYRRLGLAGLDARARRADPTVDPGIVEDHRLLVEAYESADVGLARAVIVRHTRRPPALRRP